MTLEEKGAIIKNPTHFATYCKWLELGRPPIMQFARLTGRDEGTLRGHLWAANLRLSRWAEAQPDTHAEEVIEPEQIAHREECRQLTVITTHHGADTLIAADGTLKKILLKSA